MNIPKAASDLVTFFTKFIRNKKMMPEGSFSYKRKITTHQKSLSKNQYEFLNSHLNLYYNKVKFYYI